ncbi:MAG: cytidylyltransferase domain-containing protein, partial [Actinomycetota bacterium]
MPGTIAIVQARMGSTRFPGKTLHDLCGRTLLERVLDRVSRASSVDAVVVATTQEAIDDDLARVAAGFGAAVFRGSTEDVLDRYVRAAREHGATVVVRNTADEPFLDPGLIGDVIAALGDADYASNNLEHRYPEGLDTEAVAMPALQIAWSEATRPSDREHVTPFIWRQPQRFRLVPVGAAPVRPDLRLTVDYPADLDFARAIYAALGPDRAFGLAEVIALLEERPDLLA